MKKDMIQSSLLIFSFLLFILIVSFPVFHSIQKEQKEIEEKYYNNKIIELENLPEDGEIENEKELQEFKPEYEGTNL